MAETPPAPSHFRTLPSWLLGRAAARGRRLVRAELAGVGMRMPHSAVLFAVAEFGPVAQAELGRSVGVDPKDMVAILNDLQAAGLVRRAPDPKDRRKNAITISEAGERKVGRLQELADRANEELLAPLSTAERALFVALLARIADPREGCDPAPGD